MRMFGRFANWLIEVVWSIFVFLITLPLAIALVPVFAIFLIPFVVAFVIVFVLIITFVIIILKIVIIAVIITAILHLITRILKK